MQTIREGGSSDSDVTAVAVIPCRRSWSAEVMSDTAAGNRRNARLNVSRNSSDAESSDMISSTEIRSCPAALTFSDNNCICKYLSMEIFKCNNCLEKRFMSGYWEIAKVAPGQDARTCTD